MAALLIGVLASHAWAHVSIVLTIGDPAAGEEVGPDLTLVVHAQQTIGGVDRATFRLFVDGRAVGPDEPRPILVGQDVRVPLRDLAPGRHVATIRYRPDVDEPETTNDVRFVVRAGGSGLLVPLAGAAAAVLLVAALVAWRRLRLRR
jgi:hypothetical protein